MFMMLSSYQSSCRSSPGYANEHKKRQVAADPRTKPTDSGLEFYHIGY